MLDSLNKALDDWSKVVKSWFRIDYDAIDNSKSKDINDVILEEIKEPEVPTDSQINRMTKLQLEELGREFGIELDRRKKKATLVEEIKSVISSK
tara:strand:- start:208 stop:489 length:282 start_codon:yes stop_codon:yes gene_type:complete